MWAIHGLYELPTWMCQKIWVWWVLCGLHMGCTCGIGLGWSGPHEPCQPKSVRRPESSRAAWKSWKTWRRRASQRRSWTRRLVGCLRIHEEIKISGCWEKHIQMLVQVKSMEVLVLLFLNKYNCRVCQYYWTVYLFTGWSTYFEEKHEQSLLEKNFYTHIVYMYSYILHMYLCIDIFIYM